jgi:hypothetical protein
MFFAHFVFGPFLIFVVILNVWRLSIYYNEKRNATTKCAFFIDTGKLCCRMDTSAILNDFEDMGAAAFLKQLRTYSLIMNALKKKTVFP